MSRPSPDAQATFPRVLSRGRAFVYILACRGDTRFKIGFSRDPLYRWRTLHPRFFEFFDLDQGILVATDRVSDARGLERKLLVSFADYQSFAPLDVPVSAAGHTEWFRGVLADAMRAAKAIALRDAWECHRPSEWFRSALQARKDLLFTWTAAVLEAIEFERHNTCDADSWAGATYERALVDTLTTFRAVGLDITTCVPDHVSRWYATWTADRRCS